MSMEDKLLDIIMKHGTREDKEQVSDSLLSRALERLEKIAV